MALYTQNMLQIAIELARTNRVYLQHAQSLVENLAWIAAATNHDGPDGASLWDEEDGFFYDLLRRPDGSSVPLKVRSLVGLMPLAAATYLPASVRTEFPELIEEAAGVPEPPPRRDRRPVGPRRRRRTATPRCCWHCSTSRGSGGYWPRCSTRTSSSRRTASAPYPASISTIPTCSTSTASSTGWDYLPAESDTGMFGGNSNWRGPVWMPMNVILIRALLNLYAFYGDDFKVECPTGSGRELNLLEVAKDLSDRIMGIFRARLGRPPAGSRRRADAAGGPPLP